MTRVMTAGIERSLEREEARKRLSLRIRRATWTVSVALFGAGVGISLSVLFLSAGVVIMGAAAGVALVGTLSSLVMPRLVYY